MTQDLFDQDPIPGDPSDLLNSAGIIVQSFYIDDSGLFSGWALVPTLATRRILACYTNIRVNDGGNHDQILTGSMLLMSQQLSLPVFLHWTAGFFIVSTFLISRKLAFLLPF